MHRSEITIDLGALRRNARRLREVLGNSELWAVVKADAYGHGAVDVAGAVLAEGARVLCVATTAEALELRREFPETRILVMGPTVGRELAIAREARLEVTAVDPEIPEGVPVHVKLDTGMGRWGLDSAFGPADAAHGFRTAMDIRPRLCTISRFSGDGGPVLRGAIVYGCTPAGPRAATVAALSGTAASSTCLPNARMPARQREAGGAWTKSRRPHEPTILGKRV